MFQVKFNRFMHPNVHPQRIFKRDLALLVALLVESLKETKRKKTKKTILQKSVSYPLGTVVLTFLVSLAFPSALAPRGPSPPGP